jgi:hypothetical protein
MPPGLCLFNCLPARSVIQYTKKIREKSQFGKKSAIQKYSVIQGQIESYSLLFLAVMYSPDISYIHVMYCTEKI